MTEAEEAACYRWLRDRSEPSSGTFYLSVCEAFKDVKFSKYLVDSTILNQMNRDNNEGHSNERNS